MGMLGLSGVGASVRRFWYKLKHDFLTVENVFLLAAIGLCLMLTCQSVIAMSRNWKLSEKLRAEKKELELLAVEVEASELENGYYQSEEYQELLARRSLDKQFSGENMVVMPENSEEAKNKYKNAVSGIENREYSNFEKWMMFLFPSY